VYRDNLVSRPGLAGVELWSKPAAARLERLRIEGNTFVDAGLGWGFAQHDTAANPQVGAAVLVGDNEARVDDLVFTRNRLIGGRHALVADGDPAHPGALALLAALQTRHDTWSNVGVPAVLLFRGRVLPDGTTDPGDSPTWDDLAAWQDNDVVPGQERGSIEDPALARPPERPATRFGTFPVGDAE
jgi:hypothetical protein